MLGYLHFRVYRTAETQVIVALNQDTKTLWFNLESVFPEPSLIRFKGGDFARMIVSDGSDEDEILPTVYLDSTAALEAALSIEDQELYDWMVEVCEYYQSEDMDWSIFIQSIEA